MFRNKLITVGILLTILLPITSVPAVVEVWSGDGSDNNPYVPIPYSEHSYIFPTNIAAHKNGYFVTTRPGLLYSVSDDNRDLILNLTDRVHSPSNPYAISEDGLFSVELHPDFEANGYLFVFYTTLNETRSVGPSIRLDSIISRFTLQNNEIDKASEMIILSIPLFGPWHRAGGLEFDTQGMLLASIGDDWNFIQAQDLSQIYGKIIRVNVDIQANGRNYSIPADNPFKNNATENILPEIWAYGLRNPYRIGFSDEILFVGDVGHNSYEEINMVEPGKNYGWPFYEGFQKTSFDESLGDGDYEDPFLVYPHTRPLPVDIDKPYGFAVLSGHIYKGNAFPELQNKFIFADLTGAVWYATLNSNYQVIDTKFLFQVNNSAKELSLPNDQISDISLSYEGEIILSAINSGFLYTIKNEDLPTTSTNGSEDSTTTTSQPTTSQATTSQATTSQPTTTNGYLILISGLALMTLVVIRIKRKNT